MVFSIFYSSKYVAVVTCSIARAPRNGHRPICSGAPRENVYGTVCTYSCDNGYIIEGQESLTCQESGVWSHPEPQCKGKQKDGGKENYQRSWLMVKNYQCSWLRMVSWSSSSSILSSSVSFIIDIYTVFLLTCSAAYSVQVSLSTRLVDQLLFNCVCSVINLKAYTL